MSSSLLLGILIAVTMIAVLFIVLYFLANSKYRTMLTKAQEYSKSITEMEEQHNEDQRMLRSYEITVDNYENFIITLFDDLPKKHDARSFAMKLANELAPYFKVDEENNTVSLTLYTGTNI